MQHPPSLWLATANPVPELPTLERDLYTDVAIVGGGYTGLVAAHHLSRAGVACAVLEANDAGWGASGRNGGMAVLRYKTPWSELAKRFGHERTRYLHRLLLEALDLLEETVGEYRIDCDFERCGHITAANGKAALATLSDDVRWLETEARDKVPRMLDAPSNAELTGTDCYVGGYLDRRAGGIHPFNYVRGMADALSRKGVPVYVGAEVQSLREQGEGVILETERSVIRAKQALVATNAYTDTVPFGTDLGSRLIPVWTSIVTTEPLPDELLRQIVPQRHVVSDTRHLLNYFRIAPGHRLLYGGRGSLTGTETAEVYAGLERKLAETFPALRGTAVDHRWSGKIAVTLDDFPHVGRVTPRIAYAMGYGGRGVVLTNLLGKMLAQLAMGQAIDAGPMSAAPFGRIPLHALRIPAMKAVAGYYGLLDRLKL
jgi:glycine/D-amino acid oxidase-like deaminating enzyme